MSSSILQLIALTALFSQPSVSKLPPVKREELADLIETYNSRISRAQIKYTVRYGKVGGLKAPPPKPYDPMLKDFVKDLLAGAFVPYPHGRFISGEVSLDFKSHKTYLRICDEDKSVSEFLWDGKVGTSLFPSVYPGGVETRVIITGDRQSVFDPEKGAYWRPERVTLLPVFDRTLAAMIREALQVKIEQEVIDDIPCYRVTIQEGRKVTRKETGEADELIQLHRLWLAPRYDFLPVRIERLSCRDQNDLDGSPYQIDRQFDFRQAKPGIWFPFKGRVNYVRGGDFPPAMVDSTVDSIALNEEAKIPERIEFPEGALVIDDARQLSYRVGGPSDQVDEKVAIAVNQVRGEQAAQAGQLAPVWYWIAGITLLLGASTGVFLVVLRLRRAR